MKAVRQSVHELYNCKGALAALFTKLHAEKGSLLDKCERYAGWTLPHLFPSNTGSPDQEEYQGDYQSIGARGTNHLANKLTLALFAPTRPFFRIDPDDAFVKEAEQRGYDESSLRSAFSKAERKAMKKMMHKGLRVAAPYAEKLLIVTGNALLYKPVVDDAKIQIYNLRDYCVVRDLSANLLDLVTQDRKVLSTLPIEMARLVREEDPELCDDSDVILYTRVRFHEGKFHVFQAVNDIPYQAGYATYAKNACPWIPMVWNLPRGANYGTGLIEEFSGDFHAMSTLTEAMVLGASIAADIKFLVDPTGSTDYRQLNEAASGAYVPGRPDEIQTLTVDKSQDWSTVLQILQSYERRLGQAFLLNSAVTRDAERVTAEEIRAQATELETSLGGVYSRQAEDLQQPLAYLFLEEVDFSLGDGTKLQPLVLTGLDALSRGSEAEQLLLVLNDLALIAQLPEQVTGRLELNPVITTLFTARGLDKDSYVKPEDQYQQEQQAMLQQQMNVNAAMEQDKAAAQNTGQTQ